MGRYKKLGLIFIFCAMISILCACGSSSDDRNKTSLEDYSQDNKALAFDNTAWNYDKDNDVYWQIKVEYCSDPETKDYETMGIYVPGAYFSGKKNEDGTYTCTVNEKGKVKSYTAETAPIVFPVNTAGYSAQEAPESYSYDGISEYVKAGYVYVYSGMRGRDNGYDEDDNLTYSGGAPWGVTDLKAAVRYYRYNQEQLPGSTDRIFTFGHSGGGAQSSLMGATGDSDLYYEYLTSIGAAMYDQDGEYISDAICGAMCWCPITNLDYADAAYEWNLGQYSTSGSRAKSTWTSALSKNLSESYAAYINDLKLKDEKGNTLTLEESDSGIYTAGSYYEYMVSVVEGSLNNFLEDTKFPYTQAAQTMKSDGGFGGGGNDAKKPDGEKPTGEKPSGQKPSGEKPKAGVMPGNGQKKQSNSTGKTFKTAAAYIASLNSDETWVKYNKSTNKVTITSMEAFVKHCKQATKDVGAFDDIKTSQAENQLFGNDDNDALHFDSVIAGLLEENQTAYAKYDDWQDSLVKEYTSDLEEKDKLGNASQVRQNMYNPMYYLSSYYKGNGTSTVAPYWRIRTGIEQGDTALTTEANLALALKENSNVKDVDFETVWGEAHTPAERSGDSTANFIKWVNTCVSDQK